MKRILLFLLSCTLASAAAAQDGPLWMRYPALSPDGQTIVFSYKGDLFRVPAAGGMAVPLTLHDAHDYRPVWSADGQNIAFASDRYGNFDVFVMPARGGEAKRLTYHSSDDIPSGFSPDGKAVLFSSLRTDVASNIQFPYGGLPELYQVALSGGTPKMVVSVTAEDATYTADGSAILYHDRKGYEDPWRKHHTSSVTRDLWRYEPGSKKFTQLTDWQGEDRSPLPVGDAVYFLSERNSGSFNVFKMDAKNPQQVEQISKFDKHPVRFLSAAKDGTLSYSYNGEIYLQKPGGQPAKVPIEIMVDGRTLTADILPVNANITEMALSPNGKEVALIVRGEVYVVSVEDGVSKKVTNTPQQERTVSFSPDGRSLLYAAERDGSWNVYQSSITRKEEPYFYSATVLKEVPVVATENEEFQPAYSPDGKEVAYLDERTTLKVINLDTKKSRTILEGKYNYSYSDGDQHYAWSPDSKWLLVQYLESNSWIDEVGLVSASGDGKVVNLTQSGYSDVMPKWGSEGKMIYWAADRDGQKNHGSWGGEQDIYGMFLTKEAHDRYKLTKADYALLSEQEKKDKEEKEKAEAEAKEKNKKKGDEKKEEKAKPVQVELDNIHNRRERFSLHSTTLSDALISPDGEKLYYLSNFEKGYDLWVTDLRDKSTKMLAKLGENANSLVMDKKGENLLVQADGKIFKIELKTNEKKPVSVNAEMNLVRQQEREYIFDHAWRQVQKKFYKTDLHGVDWDFYKKEYARFLPHINNNYDFSEMLSEMLGELNASHTGARYRPESKMADKTASLGLFYDQGYNGQGVLVAEVLKGGPFDKAASKIRNGVVIEKIDGVILTPEVNMYTHLNRKEGQNTLLSLYNPATKQRWDEVVKPVSTSEEMELRYQRWVENQRALVDKLSGGKIGYVHVRGMNDNSYRTTVEDVLGKNHGKQALVVDTRFNGGGWLHEDLTSLLSGKDYLEFAPRDQRLGSEPMAKWSKPSVVVMGEGNYSDAHMFPYAYKAKGLGKLVGMPVPGTGTAVWWERQIDPTLVFGIPQIGMLTPDGKYLENTQLEPDVKVHNDPSALIAGEDQQIAKAVELLLQETK